MTAPPSRLSVRNEESLMEVIEDDYQSGNPSDHIKVTIAIISLVDDFSTVAAEFTDQDYSTVLAQT
jgi:hypothetical protein